MEELYANRDEAVVPHYNGGVMTRALRIFPLVAALLAAQPAQDPSPLARKALDAFLGGRYAEFVKMGTADLQSSLPEPAVAKLADQFKSAGAVENVGNPQTTKIGPNTAVVFPVKFASRAVNFRFLMNSSGLVSGFFVLSGDAPWQPPAYSKAGAFTDKQVTIGEGEWKLPGTLTVPSGSGPFPAVVLVPGGGPADRDETIGAVRVFRDLAEGLGSQGVVALRYDKRTKVYAPRIGGMNRFTLHDELVEDAVKAAALLRTLPNVDKSRIFVLGHDLGGYAGPRIAAEDPEIAGLILMGANARHLEDLVVEQVQAAGGSAKALENAKALQAKVKSLEPGDEDLPAVFNQPITYWLNLKDYDPVADSAKIGKPMLILQGERDFQVPMKDFNLWKAGLAKSKGVVVKSYPALNHLFVAGSGPSTTAEYAKPGQHVAPEVIDDIAGFVKK